MILGDQNSNGIQFSKLIVIFTIILAIVGCGCALIFPVPETVAIALITVCGGLVTTSVVWNLKKSQSENTIKIYMAAYKEIIDLKHQYKEEDDDIYNEMENNIKCKIDKTIDESMDDATSLLEKQEVG